jgi:hypothetical protein
MNVTARAYLNAIIADSANIFAREYPMAQTFPRRISSV